MFKASDETHMAIDLVAFDILGGRGIFEGLKYT